MICNYRSEIYRYSLCQYFCAQANVSLAILGCSWHQNNNKNNYLPSKWKNNLKLCNRPHFMSLITSERKPSVKKSLAWEQKCQTQTQSCYLLGTINPNMKLWDSKPCGVRAIGRCNHRSLTLTFMHVLKFPQITGYI